MQFDKQQILSMIRDPSQAEQAAQQLPETIDHEAHSGLLQQFGIDPGQLAGSGGGQTATAGAGQDPIGGGGHDAMAGGDQSFQGSDPGSADFAGERDPGDPGQGSSSEF